jgi:hypothetical protein
MLRHLVGEQGGQLGPGRQLQRKAGQVGKFGLVAGDCQVDDARQRCGDQLV